MNEKDILTTIVEKKAIEVAQRVSETSVEVLRKRIEDQESTRGFIDAIKLKVSQKQAAVIAEIKKASPSKGVIREDFEPARIAESYERSGATCLSVLTDISFFQGSDAYLQLAKTHSKLPILRKDFIIADYQVYEARAIGADCVLLIASILDIERLHELYALAASLGLDVLVEVHNKQELDKALTLSPEMIGINNRNLKTFEVNLDTTLALLEHIPADVMVITESGIHQREDVAVMLQKEVYGFLVGEAFMRQPDPGQALEQLFG
jgi:indole-3-glycerol phosphate synthase